MVSGHQIAEAVRGYVGTPFGHRGRSPGVGGALDCVGVVVCAAAEFGIELLEPRDYTVPQRLSKTQEMVESSLRLLHQWDRSAGDVVLLNYGRGLGHLIVDVGANKCVEACALDGVRKVIIRDFPDGRPVIGTYRIPGIE